MALWTRDGIHGPGVDKEAHKNRDVIRMVIVFASMDRGKIWTRHSGVAFPRMDFDEHMTDPKWTAPAAEDAKQDFFVRLHQSPDRHERLSVLDACDV